MVCDSGERSRATSNHALHGTQAAPDIGVVMLSETISEDPPPDWDVGICDPVRKPAVLLHSLQISST